MITECTQNEIIKILYVINDAALKYKGVIPDDCWHEPYMSEQELVNGFVRGLRMFGYFKKTKLVGVMGIQELNEVNLIRHAYILTSFQGQGIGKSMLQYLLEMNQNKCLLVGTWRDATWAIKFYEKFGFILQTKEKTKQLLKKYWHIPSKQTENSIVLQK